MATTSSALTASTGVPGLDRILGGGLPQGRMYLVQGEPGTGKTTIALQFLLEGAKRGDSCLYVTFSETQDELRVVAESHGWDLKGIHMLDLSAIEQQLRPEAQNTVFHPSEVEMNQTMQLIMDQLKRHAPTRVVFDSVTELRMLSDTSLRYRRQVLALKHYFSQQKCTVLFLDDLSMLARDLQVQSVVHGVINLHKINPEFGEDRRRLNVVKLRGVEFSGGNHDYVIRKGGLQVFPRMIPSAHLTDFPYDQISSGIKELDKLLGGGLQRGTSTLILGPAGTGKSTLALQFALAAVDRGEPVAMYLFEETVHTLRSRASSLGMDLDKHLKSGLLFLRRIDPSELSPGEFVESIRQKVAKDKLKVVVIDSLNGYLQSMPEEKFLILQLHELMTFLGNQGVASILVLAQQGMLGNMQVPVDLTYLSDTVIVTRFFEAAGAVKKAVSVIKKRAGKHEPTIREFLIHAGGVSVGKPLVEFQGVLTGVPQFLGKGSQVLGASTQAKRKR